MIMSRVKPLRWSRILLQAGLEAAEMGWGRGMFLLGGPSFGLTPLSTPPAVTRPICTGTKMTAAHHGSANWPWAWAWPWPSWSPWSSSSPSSSSELADLGHITGEGGQVWGIWSHCPPWGGRSRGVVGFQMFLILDEVLGVRRGTWSSGGVGGGPGRDGPAGGDPPCPLPHPQDRAADDGEVVPGHRRGVEPPRKLHLPEPRWEWGRWGRLW